MNTLDPSLFINAILGVAFLFPAFAFLLFLKIVQPKYYLFLFWGIGLVGYSALCFRFLNDFQHGLFASNPWLLKESPEIKRVAQAIESNFEAWIYVFPAVIAAIGANLISHFLIMGNPRKKK